MKRKKYISVSHQLLRHYADRGELNVLAFSLHLKALHSNGVFYNHSLRTTAKKASVSVNYLRKMLPILEKEGWVTFDSRNMVMKSQKRVAKRIGLDKVTNVSIKSGDTWRDILDELRYVLYGTKASQLRYGWNKRLKGADSNNGVGGDLSSIRETLYDDFNTGQTQISYEGLADVWGCSKTSAFNQIQKWIAEGKLIKHKKKVDTGYSKEYIGQLTSLCGSFFLIGDVVYKQLANVYCYV